MAKTVKDKNKFTLVELLTVISIIAILAAILLPVLNKAKGKAQEMACTSNLKQLGSTVYLYSTDSSDWLPIVSHWGATYTTDNFEATNWYANSLLMSYIGWRQGISFSNPLPNLKVRFCPSEETPWGDFAGYKTLSYAMNWYFGYGYSHRRNKLAEFRTPSKTFSFADGVSYVAGASATSGYDAGQLDYRHRQNKTLNTSFLDGHVGSVSRTLPPPPLTASDPFWGRFY